MNAFLLTFDEKISCNYCRVFQKIKYPILAVLCQNVYRVCTAHPRVIALVVYCTPLQRKYGVLLAPLSNLECLY